MPCALRISEAASLAMHALGYLAVQRDQPVSARVIASRFSVSEAHLSKVLQRLVKTGMLTSLRGPKGGFSLTRAPQSVSLLEVFEAVEGPIEPTSCLFGAAVCDGESCILGKVVMEANRMLAEHLAANTLADVGAVVATRPEPVSPEGSRAGG